eukprot:4562562-Pyramimonas_sp.AAC.1
MVRNSGAPWAILAAWVSYLMSVRTSFALQSCERPRWLPQPIVSLSDRATAHTSASRNLRE